MAKPVEIALVVLTLATASCINDDPVPAFIEMGYRVRCLGACDGIPDGPTRRVDNVSEEEGFELKCAVSGGRLSFSLKCPGGDAACGSGDYSLEVRNVDLDDGEVGEPGDGCLVLASEGSNEYRGNCTDGDPSTDRPCVITGEVSGTSVTGTLLCEELPSEANQNDTRFLVGPAVTRDPAEFRLEGCEGL